MKEIWKGVFRAGLNLITVFLLSACGRPVEGSPAPQEDKPQIVVTTTFIGDVVKNIAGEKVDVTELLTAGQNPHSYQPAPMDLVAVSEADLILVNGLGLEDFLEDLLSGSDTTAKVIVVSDGIIPLMMEDHHEDGDDHHEDEDDHGSEDSLDAVLGQDPHVWFDPNNIMVWAENIRIALSEEDQENEDYYQENYEKFKKQLMELDVWIREQIEIIPQEQRELVTDHSTLGYFGQEYGLIQIGTVVPALTTEAQTSGMELAELINTIREHQTRAIFIGADFDPNLAQRVADETGVELVTLYFGSLTEGEPAGTYISFMRYNVSAIVEALR